MESFPPISIVPPKIEPPLTVPVNVPLPFTDKLVPSHNKELLLDLRESFEVPLSCPKNIPFTLYPCEPIVPLCPIEIYGLEDAPAKVIFAEETPPLLFVPMFRVFCTNDLQTHQFWLPRRNLVYLMKSMDHLNQVYQLKNLNCL